MKRQELVLLVPRLKERLLVLLLPGSLWQSWQGHQDHELPAHAMVVQNVKYFYVSQTDVGSLMEFDF